MTISIEELERRQQRHKIATIAIVVFLLFMSLMIMVYITSQTKNQSAKNLYSGANGNNLAPSEGASLYWGAYIDGGQYGEQNPPWVFDAVNTFDSHTGKNIAILSWAAPWYHGGQYYNFPASLMETVRQNGMINLFTWGSWDYAVQPQYNQPAFADVNIINGNYDAFITKWATDAKNYGKPFFLRFDWEMNGNWYPWSDGVNGNTTGQYAQMWKHVHDIFTKVGATNVTWVWCPNIQGRGNAPTARPLSQFYPGDTYVDWTCLDGYNNSGWLSFNQVFTGVGTKQYQNSYGNLTQLAPSKPIIIGETASLEAGDDGSKKAAWITDAYGTQIPLNFPQIKAVVWFNWNVSKGDTYVIESTNLAQTAFAAAIASPVYASNNFSNLPPGPIQPLSNPTPTPIPTVSPTNAPTPTSNYNTVNFTPTADSYIDASNPDTSFGSSATLRTANNPIQRTFFKFNLTSLAGKTLKSAVLQVTTTSDTHPLSNATYNLHYVFATDWSERYMTYNNQIPPNAISPNVMGSLSNPQGNTTYKIQLDVPTVQKQVGDRLSMMMETSGNDSLVIYSRNSQQGKPQLIVTY